MFLAWAHTLSMVAGSGLTPLYTLVTPAKDPCADQPDSVLRLWLPKVTGPDH